MSLERTKTNWICAALVAAIAGTSPLVSNAQPGDKAPSAEGQPADQGDGGPVRVGDRWVYDTKDELTGDPKDTYTEVVTEISPSDIVTNWTFSGKPGSSVVIYDHDWQRKDNIVWKFKPNDGQGVRMPLAIGKAWRVQFDARNTQTGVNFKSSLSSKVVGKETITTSAGTFDTFKIERTGTQFRTTDPSRVFQSQMAVWYAPEINHWVRRTTTLKYQKHVTSSTSEELSDFSRAF